MAKFASKMTERDSAPGGCFPKKKKKTGYEILVRCSERDIESVEGRGGRRLGVAI